MKPLYFFLITMLVLSSASAQSFKTSVRYNKQTQQAIGLELPFDEEISAGAIVHALKRTGYHNETKGKFFWKKEKVDGFYIFKAVQLKGLTTPIDMYFRIEQKSKKQKDHSIIYLMIGKSDGTFIGSETEEDINSAASKFLNQFIEDAVAYKLQLDIEAQEEIVKAAEKRLSKLQDNDKDLNKKLENVQKDLKSNQGDLQEQSKILQEEKKKLEQLKDKV